MSIKRSKCDEWQWLCDDNICLLKRFKSPDELTELLRNHLRRQQPSIVDLLPDNILRIILERYVVKPTNIANFCSASVRAAKCCSGVEIRFFTDSTKNGASYFGEAISPREIGTCRDIIHLNLYTRARRYNFSNVELCLDSEFDECYMPLYDKEVCMLNRVQYSVDQVVKSNSKELGVLRVRNHWKPLFVGHIGRHKFLRVMEISDCGILVGLGQCLRETRLEWLKVRKTDFDVADMTEFQHCDSLRTLSLTAIDQVTCLTPFLKMKKLQKLCVRQCSGLVSIGCPEHACHELTALQIIESPQLLNTNTIANLKSLIHLEIRSCRGLSNVSEVGELDTLEMLELCYCPHVDDFRWLKSLKSLWRLTCASQKFNWPHKLQEIGKCKGLVQLFMNHWPQLNQLNAIGSLNTIEDLSLAGCVRLTCIKLLETAPLLKVLCLSGCRALTCIGPLANAKQLEDLDITDCPRIGMRQCKSVISQLLGHRLVVLRATNYEELYSLEIMRLCKGIDVTFT